MAFATESIFGYSISYTMDNRDTKNMNGAETSTCCLPARVIILFSEALFTRHKLTRIRPGLCLHDTFLN